MNSTSNLFVTLPLWVTQSTSQSIPGHSCFPVSLPKQEDMPARCSTSPLEELGPNESPVQNNKNTPKMFLQQHTSLVFINA